jgi:hypothetical protein
MPSPSVATISQCRCHHMFKWLAVAICAVGLSLGSALASANAGDSGFAAPDCSSLRASVPSSVEIYVHAQGCGETQTLQVLWSESEERTSVLAKIASGQPDWMDIALLLLPHANHMQSAELGDSIQEALVAAPGMVLGRLAANPSALKTACGIPSDMRYDLALSSITERISAVLTWMSDQSEKVDRRTVLAAEKCSRLLDQAEEFVQRQLRR